MGAMGFTDNAIAPMGRSCGKPAIEALAGIRRVKQIPRCARDDIAFGDVIKKLDPVSSAILGLHGMSSS